MTNQTILNRANYSGAASAFEKAVVKNTYTNTNEEFMDRMLNGCAYGIEVDENNGIGQETNAGTAYALIRLLPDEKFVTIANQALRAALKDNDNFSKFGKGTGKYRGLIIESIQADEIEMEKVNVSPEEEQFIIDEILDSDLQEVTNLRKIFDDVNNFFRMYQELLIDAAKKLYVITDTFFQNWVVANINTSLTHNFTSFKDIENFKIDYAGDNVTRDTKDEEGNTVIREVGDFEERLDKKGEIKGIAFKDDLDDIRQVHAQGFCDFMKTDVKAAYEKVGLTDALVSEFSAKNYLFEYAKDVYTQIKTPYAYAVSKRAQSINALNESKTNRMISDYQFKNSVELENELLEKEINRLSALANYMLRELPTPLAGKVMFMASHLTKKSQLEALTNNSVITESAFGNGSDIVNEANEKLLKTQYGPLQFIIDPHSTNTMYKRIAHELFLAYFMEEFAETKVCGYRLIGNTADINEGDILTFKNGYVTNLKEETNLHVDSNYNGKLTVQIINGNLCAVKKIEIQRREIVKPDEIRVSIYRTSVIDCQHFFFNNEIVQAKKVGYQGRELQLLIDQLIFEKSTKLTVYPKFTYGPNMNRNLLNAVVATVVTNNGEVNIPIGQYSCYSDLGEKLLAGLSSREFEVQNFKANESVINIHMKNYEFSNVALNHCSDNAIITNDDFVVENYAFGNVQNNTNVEQSAFSITTGNEFIDDLSLNEDRYGNSSMDDTTDYDLYEKMFM